MTKAFSKANANVRRQMSSASHGARYSFADPKWWKVTKYHGRLNCSLCGDMAVKIVEGKPLCSNCKKDANDQDVYR